MDERGAPAGPPPAGWRLLCGPVRLVIDGADAGLGPPRQRCVLAVLLLAEGRGVPVDTLVERVWDERPPRARNPIAPYVARLRRVIGPAGTLSYQAGGYRLACDPETVDVHRARRLAGAGRAAARTGEHDRAAGLMRAALAGWLGETPTGLPGRWAAGIRDSLRRERADLLADWAEVALRVSRTAEVIEALRPAVAEDPAAERLAAALMAAYAADGQVAAALDCYAGLRAAVAERFGSEPSAPVRELHVRLLRGSPAVGAGASAAGVAASEPGARPAAVVPAVPVPAAVVPAAVVPAQLPLAVRGFAGRRAELARLDALPGEAPAIAVLHGSPGVGKTTLAVHWAHRVADRFPDGQLFVNLRGADPGGRGVDPFQAVRSFLRALGVPAERVPPDRDGQAALYRSRLAGRRVLIVLDNARDADQVRPLLPGAGAAVVVVTSRDQLTALVAAEGARPIRLDVLSGAHARRLLAHRLGDDRTAAEPEAVRQIVTACAGLPLALVIASARAQRSGSRLATIAAELADADRRIEALDAGDASTRAGAVFSWSYTALPPPAATLFRLLSLHPGPDLAAPAAAALLGEPVPGVRRRLAELAHRSLLAEHGDGRYARHDLLRAYAADLARTHDPADRREAARLRLLDHYVHTAHAANRLLDPTREPMPVPLGAPTGVVVPLAGRDEAMRWFAAESDVLAAVLRSAADRPLHVWQLAWAMDTFLFRRGHWHDLAAVWRAALTAGERLDDPRATAYAGNLLAYAEVLLGRHRDAERHFARALCLHERAGDPGGLAHTHRNLGFLRWRQGDRKAALDHALRALAGYRAAGLPKGTADALNAVGWCHAELGDHAAALEHCRAALAYYRAARDTHGEAATWDSLGYAYHHLADFARATRCYGRSVELYAEGGDLHNQAEALTHLGDSHRAAGDADAARAAWRRAHDLLTSLGHPDAGALRARIEALAATTR